MTDLGYAPVWVVVAVGVLLRMAPAFVWRRFGVDASTHFMIADTIREQRRLPEKLWWLAVDDTFDYPPGFGVLLALMPRRYVYRLGHLLNPMLDSAVLTALGLVATSSLQASPAGALLAVTLYAVSPVALEHTLHVTARVIGSILLTAGAVGMVMATVRGSLAWILVSVLAMALLPMVSKMGLQAGVVVVVGLGIVYASAVPSLILLGGLALALVLFRHGFVRVICGHVRFLAWARHNLVGLRNDPLTRFRGKPLEHGSPGQRARWAVTAALAWQNPMAVYVAVLSLIAPPLLADRSSFVLGLSAWVLALWVASVLAGDYGPLRWLGEGYRYLEYATLPAALLLCVVDVGMGWALPLGAGLAICLRQLPRFLRAHRDERDPNNSDFHAVSADVRKAGSAGVVWALPYALMAPLALLSQRRVLSSLSPAGLQRAAGFIPQLVSRPQDVVMEFGVDTVLLDRTYVTAESLGFGGWQVISSHGAYEVRVRSGEETG